MKAKLAKAIAALDRLVDYFIPPEVAADRDTRNRAHVFLVSHILGPFIGNVVPISIFVLDPSPGYDVAVLAASITAFWVFPFLLRAGVPYNPLALVSIENLIFCIFWSCYFYGGVTSPTLAWVLVIPLLAFFYLGSSSSLRLIVMTMFTVNVGIFGFFYFFGFEINNKLPVAAMQGLGLVSTTAAAIYVAMMALYYAKIQASQGELESEMREHMATAIALRAATEEADRASAAKADFLTKIHTAGQHLLKLVNEVLDLSKIEAGKMELDLAETDLAGLLLEIADGARPAAVRNGNEFRCTVSPYLGTALCDAGKFRNLVGQLLDNAAKFTQHGKVELVARRITNDDDDQLVVDVIDTGIGIAPDQITHLFEKFTVADDSSTSKYGGTGLGLALSQKLCKLMGGEVSVESELGKGSSFTIRMPLTAGRRKADLHVVATLVPAAPDLALQPAAEMLHA